MISINEQRSGPLGGAYGGRGVAIGCCQKQFATILCHLRDDVKHQLESVPSNESIFDWVSRQNVDHQPSQDWEDTTVTLLLKMRSEAPTPLRTLAVSALAHMKAVRKSSYIWLH